MTAILQRNYATERRFPFSGLGLLQDSWIPLKKSVGGPGGVFWSGDESTNASEVSDVGVANTEWARRVPTEGDFFNGILDFCTMRSSPIANPGPIAERIDAGFAARITSRRKVVLSPDYAALAAEVVRELEAYAPPPPHPEQVGQPLPPEWFKAGLDRMRGALVAPYTLTVVEGESGPGQVATREVVIVADDRDQALLAFDPNPEGDFVVIWRRPGSFAISHLRGDAVGSFLSI